METSLNDWRLFAARKKNQLSQLRISFFMAGLILARWEASGQSAGSSRRKGQKKPAESARADPAGLGGPSTIFDFLALLLFELLQLLLHLLQFFL